MKRTYYLVMLLLTCVFVNACKKSEITDENTFDKSYKAWTDFKTSSNNAYVYVTNTASWTGYRTATVITVKNGKLFKRTYLATMPAAGTPSSTEVKIVQNWTEEENQINSHADVGKAMTLDEVYQKAKTEWLLKRKDATSSIETKNDGMISNCGFVPNNCQDDCFIGISISSIKKL